MELYDLIEPIELTEGIRQLVAPEDAPVNEFRLSNWFPPRLVGGIDWEFLAGTTRDYTDAMPFRGWTSRAPIGTQPGRIRKSGEMPPLSKMWLLTEYDRIKQRVAAGQGGDLAEAIAGDVYNHIGQGAKALTNRMELLAADALVAGAATLDENGVELDVDYARSADRESTVGIDWSDATLATPLDDEETIMDTMSDSEGLGPDSLVAFASRATVRDWKSTDQVRDAFPDVRAPTRVPMGAINEFRAEHDFPPFVVYNASTNDSAGTLTQFIPDGQVVYAPANEVLGSTQYGVPAAASEPDLALELSQQPGPIAYLLREWNPLKVYTMVEAIAFVVFTNTSRTYALDVSP